MKLQRFYYILFVFTSTILHSCVCIFLSNKIVFRWISCENISGMFFYYFCNSLCNYYYR